ncbi:Transposase, IS110 family [Yersinia frederiksenii ATCC 33641]|nr:Transposase, IS110 family [Yersinia frederiksenii ATCC 33641]
MLPRTQDCAGRRCNMAMILNSTQPGNSTTQRYHLTCNSLMVK